MLLYWSPLTGWWNWVYCGLSSRHPYSTDLLARKRAEQVVANDLGEIDRTRPQRASDLVLEDAESALRRRYGLRDLPVLQSDGELINAVLSGNGKAFAILVERYEQSVRAVTLSVLRDAHLAQDAAQDAFVKAYQKLGSLKRAGAFGPWLLKISRRCALDIVDQRREVSLPDHDIPEAQSAGLLDEEKERLLAAVLKLAPSERQVVMLRYFSGHSVKEVADIAGRSVGTVTKQLSRARRQLRAFLPEI